jgi:NAD-dependent SIR2 family protein deacetylase
MTDTILTMIDGSKWKPSGSSDTVHCIHCDNAVDTPEEIKSYPKGKCPDCGNPWIGSERRSTSINVTAPEAISGEV